MAVKKLHSGLGKDVLDALLEETGLLAQVSHPNCLQLLGVCLDPDNVCMVTELLHGGDLHAALFRDSSRVLTLPESLFIVIEIAQGIEYLHRKNIVHADIKPLNILLDRDMKVVKVADFGLSSFYDLAMPSVFQGTLNYMAPELFDGSSGSSQASDVFAFGVLAWEVCSRSRAFAGINRKQNWYAPLPRLSSVVDLPDPAASHIQNIIDACLDPNPARRPPFSEIISMLRSSASSLSKGYVFPSVPQLPPVYLPRSGDLQSVVPLLLDESSRASTLTGSLGSGKSTFGSALVRSDPVTSAFPDGIHWLHIGADPALPALQLRLLHELGLSSIPSVASVAEGRYKLAQVFETSSSLRKLVVLDDVRLLRHIRAFDVLNSSSKLLVISPVRSLWSSPHVSHYHLGPLPNTDALALLAASSGIPIPSLPQPAASTLLSTVANLPLAIQVIGSVLRKQSPSSILSPDIWTNLIQSFSPSSSSPSSSPSSSSDSPSANPTSLLFSSVSLSVSVVGPLRYRFHDLAVFASQPLPIPIHPLLTLWSSLAEPLNQADIRFVVETLAAHSLVDLKPKSNQSSIIIPKLQSSYLLSHADQTLPALHQTLLQNYAASLPKAPSDPDNPHPHPWWQTPLPPGPGRSYFFASLVHHLACSPQGPTELASLLLAFPWISTQLEETSLTRLLLDYKVALGLEHLSQHARHALESVATSVALSAPALRSSHALSNTWLARTRSMDDASHSDPIVPLVLAEQIYGRLVGLSHVPALLPLIESASAASTIELVAGELEGVKAACIQNLEGHTAPVRAVLVSSDAHTVVSAAEDLSVRVFDLIGGSEVHNLVGHTYYVLCLCFSPDESIVFSGSGDHTIRAWSMDSGIALGCFRGHSDRVQAIATTTLPPSLVSSSPSLASESPPYLLVSVSNDATIRMWNPESTSLLLTIPAAHDGWIRSVTASPRLIITSSVDRTIAVWDTSALLSAPDSITPLARLTHHSNSVIALDYAQTDVHGTASGPGVGTLVSAADDRTARIWIQNQDDLSFTPSHVLKGHNEVVRCITLALPLVITGSNDRSIRVWDAPSGTCVRTLLGHEGWVRAVASIPGSDRFLVSGSADTKLKVWDLAKEGEAPLALAREQLWIYAIAVAPESSLVATGATDKVVRVWNTAGYQIASFAGHTGWIRALAWSRSGSVLFSGSNDKSIHVWTLGSDTPLAVIKAHAKDVRTLSVVHHPADPERSLLLSGSNDRTVAVHDVTDPADPVLLARIGDHTNVVRTVALAGPWIASGSEDTFLYLYNLESVLASGPNETYTGPVHALAHNGFVMDAAVGPTFVATACADTSIYLWSRKDDSFAPLGRLEGVHTDWITSLSLSPDGSHLLSSSLDSSIVVWCVEEQRVEATLSGHGDAQVRALSLDGSLAYSGASDGSVVVWDWESGKEIHALFGRDEFRSPLSLAPTASSPSASGVLGAVGMTSGEVLLYTSTAASSRWQSVRTPTPHTGPITCLCMSPDAKWMATGSTDAVVAVYPLGPEWGGTLSPSRLLKGHTGWITGLCFASPTLLVTSSRDGSVMVWDLGDEGEDEESACRVVLEGHSSWVRGVTVVPEHPDIALSWSDDKTLRVWDLDSGTPGLVLDKHDTSVLSATVSKDGCTVASASFGSRVLIWRAPDGLASTSAQDVVVVSVSVNTDHIYSLSFTGGDHIVVVNHGASLVDTRVLRLVDELSFNEVAEEGLREVVVRKPDPTSLVMLDPMTASILGVYVFDHAIVSVDVRGSVILVVCEGTRGYILRSHHRE